MLIGIEETSSGAIATEVAVVKDGVKTVTNLDSFMKTRRTFNSYGDVVSDKIKLIDKATRVLMAKIAMGDDESRRELINISKDVAISQINHVYRAVMHLPRVERLIDKYNCVLFDEIDWYAVKEGQND